MAVTVSVGGRCVVVVFTSSGPTVAMAVTSPARRDDLDGETSAGAGGQVGDAEK